MTTGAQTDLVTALLNQGIIGAILIFAVTAWFREWIYSAGRVHELLQSKDEANDRLIDEMNKRRTDREVHYEELIGLKDETLKMVVDDRNMWRKKAEDAESILQQSIDLAQAASERRDTPRRGARTT